MKTKMNVCFEGSLAEFNEYIENTFRDTSKLCLTVTITDKLIPNPLRQLMCEIQRNNSNISEDRLQMRLEDALLTFRQGNKIDAIKMIREISGLGLKEAKDFVESEGFQMLTR